MRGFGSPDHIDQNDTGETFGVGPIPPDWGFGAAEPSSWDTTTKDKGFGSPDYFSADTILVSLDTASEVPDNGGVLLRLLASWPTLGPFRVYLLDAATGKRYPELPVKGCTAPVDFFNDRILSRTDPTACFVVPKLPELGDVGAPSPGRLLSCVLPPVPPSRYDIVIQWGGGAVTLSGVLSVVYRGRSRIAWDVRRGLPRDWAVGSVSARTESLLGV